MVVNLRPYVNVQTAKVHVFAGRDVLYHVEGVAVHVKTEFAERRGGHNRLVGVGGNAGVHSHQHVLHPAEFPRLFVNHIQLVEAVHDEIPYASGKRFVNLFFRLVVAVEKHFAHIRARLRHEIKLSARHDVEPQPVLCGYFRRCDRGKSLVGKCDRALAVTPHRGDEGVAHLFDVFRVHNVKRGAETRGKFRRLERTYIKVSVLHIKCFACIHK